MVREDRDTPAFASRVGSVSLRSPPGKIRGKVVFNYGSPTASFSCLLAVKASGYRGRTIRVADEFPHGIAYEDPSPRTIRVRLSPAPAR